MNQRNETCYYVIKIKTKTTFLDFFEFLICLYALCFFFSLNHFQRNNNNNNNNNGNVNNVKTITTTTTAKTTTTAMSTITTIKMCDGDSALAANLVMIKGVK